MQAGESVVLKSTGQRAVVRGLLGEGGQGRVYEVDVRGTSHALKWYHPDAGTADQRRLIEDLIERGAPNSRFLWPEEVAERSDGADRFGYTMPMLPANYVRMAELMKDAATPTPWGVCTAAFQLADAFLRLHSQGLCYRDISLGNVFIDPVEGSTLICDNDNIGIDGMSPANVMGTRRFMAPEIVRREAMPSRATDLYSLSVLLFYLLMWGHPLVGQRDDEHVLWTEVAESDLFGKRPLFVFDPDDESNRPAPERTVQTFWQLWPEVVRERFTRAFTIGLHDPARRVQEGEWRSTMSQVRDLLATCPWCGEDVFWDPSSPESRSCWSCHRTAPPPLRLQFGHGALVLREGATVCAHHLRRNYDFTVRHARVTRHPSHADRFGLQNVGPAPWRVRTVDGKDRVVDPGQAVGLLPGIQIHFADGVAELLAG